jgi:hypothetical protein
MEFLFREDKDPIRGESDCPGFRKFYAGGTVEYAMLIDCNGVHMCCAMAGQDLVVWQPRGRKWLRRWVRVARCMTQGGLRIGFPPSQSTLCLVAIVQLVQLISIPSQVIPRLTDELPAAKPSAACPWG